MEIADYTLDTWGEAQANHYLTGFEACFRQLAQAPGMGRACDEIRPGYRRVEHDRHVVIYRADCDGIFISRILHQRMMPKLRNFEDS